MDSNDYKPFKFATEAGINMHLGEYQLCQQEDFDFLVDDPQLPLYNIYFICQRNRVSVQPDSMNCNGSSLSFVFNIHEEDKTFQVPGGFSRPGFSKVTKFESVYPHASFILTNDKDERIYVKSDSVLQESAENILPRPAFLDLEVLYIGQTQRSSDKPIIDRLISHKTLQAIYAKKRPDKEIHILFCNFNFTGNVEVRGTVRTQKKYEALDQQRLLNFMHTQVRLTQADEINITEAALIKYFDPEYNKLHKYFPKKDNKSYEILYKMDLNSFSIEINTSLYFFSKKVPTSNHHYERFHLLNDEERRKLFDYSVGFDVNI